MLSDVSNTNNISNCDANASKYALNKDFQKELKYLKQNTSSINNNNNNSYNYKEDMNYAENNNNENNYTPKNSNILKNYSNNYNNNNSSNNNNYKNNNSSYNYNNNNNNNIEKTIKEIVDKTIEDKYKQRSRYNNDDFNDDEILKIASSYRKERDNNEKKVINFELDHIKQENITVKNDNIILREDINRLNEIGVSLENELEYTRKKK